MRGTTSFAWHLAQRPRYGQISAGEPEWHRLRRATVHNYKELRYGAGVICSYALILPSRGAALYISLGFSVCICGSTAKH